MIEAAAGCSFRTPPTSAQERARNLRDSERFGVARSPEHVPGGRPHRREHRPRGMLHGARQTVDLTPPVRFGGR
jgi:hypothetical protein